MKPTNQKDNNINKNQKRLYNPRQTNQQKANNAQWDIFEALSDGQWHRYTDLEKTTKLNSNTLTKHLNQLTKDQIIDKDSKSRKNVLYKAPIELIDIIISNRINKKFSNWIDEWIKDELQKTIIDPLTILESINNITQVGFLRLLEEIQRDKKINANQITFLEEILITKFYNYAIKELVTATWQIIDKIDINKMLVTQAIRLKQVYEQVLKKYEKSGTVNQVLKHYEKLGIDLQEIFQEEPPDYSI